MDKLKQFIEKQDGYTVKEITDVTDNPNIVLVNMLAQKITIDNMTYVFTAHFRDINILEVYFIIKDSDNE